MTHQYRRATEQQHSEQAVAQAYGNMSAGIEGLLGTTIAPADPDRQLIEPWAAAVNGPILDVGSGTGRWTAHLAGLGADIAGLEPALPLVRRARETHPDVTFYHGSAADLADCPRQWAGILAWYSVIHMGPQELSQALENFHGVLDDDGTLLLSFFTGPGARSIAHPVAPAYLVPMGQMRRALRAAGFTVVSARHSDHGPHAHLAARAEAL